MAGAAGKLRFSILSCSGEDPDYPSRELLFHSAQTRGWQVPRFCKYPQEITLQLEQPSRIHQIQILSHEYKIATKLELYVGMAAAGQDPGRAQMRRLGHLSFDSNERSGHQARELKSVHVNTNASVFRLVVQRCHVNKLNIYNQVGIVALNLIGEPLGPGALDQRPPMMSSRIPDAADIALDMNVDSKTAMKIRELHALKAAAVAAEDYDEAKRIKGAIDRLKSVGQKIGQLESKKAAAVEREDYDLAKQLKHDIDKMRHAAESDHFYAGSRRNSARGRSTDPQEIFDRVLDAAGVPAGMPGPPHDDHDNGYGGSYHTSPTGNGPRLSEGYGDEVIYDADLSPGAGSMYRTSQDNGYDFNNGAHQGGQMYEAYDERPAQGKGEYRLDSPSLQALQNPPAPLSDKRQPAKASSRQEPGAPKPPEGFPPDLPSPEPLNAADATAAEPLAELLGEYTASCLFSKNWQLREAGMQMMEKYLTDGTLPVGANPRDEMRQLTKAVSRALKDKVANVLQCGMTNMRCLLDTYGSHVSNKDIMASSADFVPLLVEKTGDNSSRMQAIATEGIMYLAATPGMAAVLAPHVCKPAKNQTAWKPILARLNLLQILIEQFGVQAGAGNGLPLDGVMNYVAAAFTSPNGEVRSAAVQCTVDVHQLGNPVRSFFPDSMNKALRDQLEAALDGSGDSPLNPNAGQSEATSVKAKDRTPARAPKATPSPAAAPARKQPSGAPVQPATAKQVPIADDSAGPLLDEEDPALYERELSEREAALGPDHPDVAESLSNLAILYNQQGDHEKALPLYERALAIWERTQGPESSDVAHTLTDMAVLHLEQGRDEEGRPLLERALEIQRKNLGDDHPDVIAILEVLESDE